MLASSITSSPTHLERSNMMDERVIYPATPQPEARTHDPDILMSEFSHHLMHPETDSVAEVHDDSEASNIMHDLNETAAELKLRDVLVTIAKVLIEPKQGKAETASLSLAPYSLSPFNHYARPLLSSGYTLRWPELSPKNYSPHDSSDFIEVAVFCYESAPNLRFIKISMSNQPVHHRDIIFPIDESDTQLQSQLETALLRVASQMGLHSWSSYRF